MSEISIFDARLAEIDRRLSRIQTGLAEVQRSEGESSGPTLGQADEPAVDPVGGLPPRVEVPEPGASVRPTPGAPIRPPGASVRPAPGTRSSGDTAELLAGLRQLTEVHERLLDSTRGLLTAYERTLAQLQEPSSVSVSAGPLASTQALRAFAETLERLPVVRDVEVRGYEGGDRVIVDVHLLDATS
jgi:hypothetical protein